MASTVWRGQLVFGLVSIPIRLFRAARKERVRMRYVREPAEDPGDYERASEAEAEGVSELLPGSEESAGPVFEREEPPETRARPVTEVKQQLIGAADEEPVSRAEVKKAYEYAPRQYVVFSDEELRRLRPKTSTEMQILRAVRLAEIDPIYFETSYFIAPDRGGEKAYALLFSALQKTGHVALAKVAMHGSEHIVLIRPGLHGLLAHTIFYEDEIRAENEYRAPADAVGTKELELATAFVNAISAPFRPDEFKDSYREQGLQATFNRRYAGGLTFTAGYTFSKQLDNLLGSARNPYGYSLEKSRGGIDHRHVFQGALAYQLPFGARRRFNSGNVVARGLMSGWNLSGVVTFASGSPLALTGSACNAGGILGTCIPSYNSAFSGDVRINGGYGEGNVTGGSPTTYLNRAAFMAPAAYTWGNLPRTGVYGLNAPPVYSLDLSVRREIAIRERVKLAIQADAFNAFNAVCFAAPASNPDQASFCTVTAQANQPRKLQLNARITF